MPTLDDIYEEKPAPKTRASSGSAVFDVAASLTPPGMAEAVGNFAKPSILPTAGSIALPAALTALAGPANAPFIPLEQGVGSGMGEAANQMFGITEPSLTNIGVSAALPTALGYGANALRALKTVVPLSAGAETLNALAPKEAAAKVAGYRTGKDVTQLFKQATAGGEKIGMENTLAAIDGELSRLNSTEVSKRANAQVIKFLETARKDIVASNQLYGMNVKTVPTRSMQPGPNTGMSVKEVRGPSVPTGLTVNESRDAEGKLIGLTTGVKTRGTEGGPLEGMTVKTTSTGQDVAGPLEGFKMSVSETRGPNTISPNPQITPSGWQTVAHSLGELVGDAKRNAKPGEKAYSTVFAAMQNDLDEAGGSVLKYARNTFKREQVINEIDDAIAGAFKINRGQGEAGQFNANKIINTLQDEGDTLGKFFKQAFTGAERKDLVDFFKFLNTIPTLKPGAGQQYGSGRAIRDVLAPATAAGGAGFASSGGDPLITGLATAAGALAPQAAESVTMLRQVWSLPGGRQMLKGLLANSDGALTPQVMGALGAFLSGQSSGANVSPAGTVRPFPMEQ